MTTAITDPTDPLGPITELAGVATAVAAARLAVDRMSGHRVLRRDGNRVHTESLIRGAAAAAALAIGRPVPADEARSAADQPVGANPAVRGAARAYLGLDELVAVWRQAPRQALARLHMLAARDLVAPAALGRPTLGSPGTRRLDQLLDVVRVTRAPAVVVAAVVHGELATLRPFGSADLVVAMAASRLVLAAGGFDPRSYVAVEVGHAADPDAYRDGLGDFSNGSADGLQRWIEHYAGAIRIGAQETSAIAEALARG